MGFCRIPLWDKQLALAGFRLRAADALDASRGEQSSLWSSLALLGFAEIRPALSGLCLWELSGAEWSQALAMMGQKSSFDQWCRHLRDCRIGVRSPAAASEPQALDGSLALVAALASRGVATHCGGFRLDQPSIALASRCSGVGLDASTLGPALARSLATRFKGAGKLAIVENLPERELAAQFGAEGLGPFCGSALWSPGSQRGSRFEPATASILGALGLAFADAELDLVEDEIKRDPALAYKFIALLNSPALRRSEKGVSSVRQGVMLLGRAQLAQWLALLLLRSGQGKPEQTALRWGICARAKLCELLAQTGPAASAAFASEAFVCGTFSGLDAALDLPLELILSECRLPAPLAAALLRAEGRLGALLMLAIACERPEGLLASDAALVARAGVPAAKLTELRREAFQWAIGAL